MWRGSDRMCKESVGEQAPSVDLLKETEDYYRALAEELFEAVRDVRSGNLEQAKAAVQGVRDLRTALQMVMDERTRVEKLRRQFAGVAAGRELAFDFDAARAEIGRRLARLRNAG